MKLVQTHTGKIHKASDKDGRPVCASRSTNFESEFIALHPSEGEQSEIDCKKCLAKIKKYSIPEDSVFIELCPHGSSKIVDANTIHTAPRDTKSRFFAVSGSATLTEFMEWACKSTTSKTKSDKFMEINLNMKRKVK